MDKQAVSQFIDLQTLIAKNRRLLPYLMDFTEDNYGEWAMFTEAIDASQNELEKPMIEFLKTGKGDRLLDALSKVVTSYAVQRERDYLFDNPEPVEKIYFPRTL